MTDNEKQTIWVDVLIGARIEVFADPAERLAACGVAELEGSIRAGNEIDCGDLLEGALDLRLVAVGNEPVADMKGLLKFTKQIIDQKKIVDSELAELRRILVEEAGTVDLMGVDLAGHAGLASDTYAPIAERMRVAALGENWDKPAPDEQPRPTLKVVPS